MTRILLALAMLGACLAQARDIEVKHKDGGFSTARLTARVGDKLVFRNEDRLFHNVFSVSKAQWFNLGAYPRGAAMSVSLLREGTVDIECAMHPEEKLTVTVTR